MHFYSKRDRTAIALAAMVFLLPQAAYASEAATESLWGSEENETEMATEAPSGEATVVVASVFQLEENGDWWIETEGGNLYSIPSELGVPEEGDAIDISYTGTEIVSWGIDEDVILTESGTYAVTTDAVSADAGMTEEDTGETRHSMVLWVRSARTYIAGDGSGTMIALTSFDGKEYNMPLEGNESLTEAGMLGSNWAWISITYSENVSTGELKILAWEESEYLERLSLIGLAIASILFVVGMGLGFKTVAKANGRFKGTAWGAFYILISSTAFFGMILLLRWLGTTPKG